MQDFISGSPDGTAPAFPTQPLTIRDFAHYYDHPEAEVRQAMRQLSIQSQSQGRGKPVLLLPEDQEQILDYLEGPLEEEAQSTPPQSAPLQSAPSQSAPPQPTLQPFPVPGPRPIQPVPQPSVPSAPATVQNPWRGEIEISTGNHRRTLETPSMPHAYDLAKFRGEEAIASYNDPGAVVSQAMNAIEALVAGMDADIRQQRHQLQETQEAAQALRLKAKQLQDKKLEYMIHSANLGQAQQRTTAELQEALREIQVLGKSPANGQEPQSS